MRVHSPLSVESRTSFTTHWCVHGYLYLSKQKKSQGSSRLGVSPCWWAEPGQEFRQLHHGIIRRGLGDVTGTVTSLGHWQNKFSEKSIPIGGVSDLESSLLVKIPQESNAKASSSGLKVPSASSQHKAGVDEALTLSPKAGKKSLDASTSHSVETSPPVQKKPELSFYQRMRQEAPIQKEYLNSLMRQREYARAEYHTAYLRAQQSYWFFALRSTPEVKKAKEKLDEIDRLINKIGDRVRDAELDVAKQFASEYAARKAHTNPTGQWGDKSEQWFKDKEYVEKTNIAAHSKKPA